MKKCPECESLNRKEFDRDFTRGRWSFRIIWECQDCGTLFTKDGCYERKRREISVLEDYATLEEGFRILDNDTGSLVFD